MTSVQHTARSASMLAGLALGGCGTLLALDDYRVEARSKAPPDCSTADAGTSACEGAAPGVDSCTGGKRCANGAAQTCVDGTWQTTRECAEECEAGECVPICSEGRAQCEGNVLRRCRSEQYAFERTCAQVCVQDEEGGNDFCAECRPYDKGCDNSTPRTCSADGRWVPSAACTGELLLCAPETAECICREGASACVGSTAERRCVSGQLVQAPCNADATCVGNRCRVPEWDFVFQVATTGPFGGAHEVSTDADGNVFVVGDYGTAPPFVEESQVFVRKYGGSGSQTPLWSLDVGVAGPEDGEAIAVDASGNIVIAGRTSGNLSSPSSGDDDVFVRKYSNAGTLIWDEQFGSDSVEGALAVAVDASGNVLVCGLTNGALPGNSAAGRSDGFVTKFSSAGVLLWTLQIGGEDTDRVYAVAADASGNVIVAGDTVGEDAFVRKYSADGNPVPLWARQIGAAGEPIGVTSVAVDASGNVLVGGQVFGPLPGQASLGEGDAYVVKYDANGTEPPLWIQQFGTSADDSVEALRVDARGHVYVGGRTLGTLEGQPAFGARDGFAMRFDPDGNLGWARQFGGADGEEVTGMALDRAGSVIVTGIISFVDQDASFLRKLVE